MSSYMIMRFFRHGYESIVVEKGLTEEEAREHCADPETSSLTCTSEEGIKRTETYGPWFEGFTKEEE